MAENAESAPTQEAAEQAPLEVSDEFVESFAVEMQATGFIAPEEDGGEGEPEAEPAEEESTSEEAPPAPSEETTEAEPTPDTAVASAIEWIRRQPGGAHAQLDGMSREALLAWGTEAKAAHDASQRLAQEAAELRKRGESAPEQRDEASTEEPGAPAPVDQPSDANLQGALDTFRTEFGSEAAEALQGVVTPLIAQVQQMGSVIEGMAAKAGQDAAEAAVQSLAQSGSYPDLQRAEARGAVLDMARARVRDGAAADIAQAVRDAAVTVYGQGRPTPPADARDDGVARIEGRSGAVPEKPLTANERLDKTIADGVAELEGRDDWEQELLSRAFTI